MHMFIDCSQTESKSKIISQQIKFCTSFDLKRSKQITLKAYSRISTTFDCKNLYMKVTMSRLSNKCIKLLVSSTTRWIIITDKQSITILVVIYLGSSWATLRMKSNKSFKILLSNRFSLAPSTNNSNRPMVFSQSVYLRLFSLIRDRIFMIGSTPNV